MKHIDIKYWFLCEEIEKKNFSLQKVSSADNIADIFTKALPKAKFINLRTRLNTRPVAQITNKTITAMGFLVGINYAYV